MKHISEKALQYLLIGFLGILTTAYSGKAQVFKHGVASGDPLQDRVIIWTRISPDLMTSTYRVSYYMATDSGFHSIIRHGEYQTDEEQDFTVKVDIERLAPNQVYFFRFIADNDTSPIGRTRTLPINEVDSLRLVIMSCSNYEDGYFHAYRHAATQTNLNAIVHLGDYIYESFYRTKRKTRNHEPAKELYELADYRQRYAQYRLDTNLQYAHRLHPFITIWDDHEASNNAHQHGAIYHNSIEYHWEERVKAAKQAYFEWMPIRQQANNKIYRKLNFGNLADLLMIDSRLEGRNEQIYNVADERINSPSRTMLGSRQRSWLLHELGSSRAKWKLLGNQVVFSPLYGKHIHKRVEDRLLDIWDGYPAERLMITQFLRDQDIANTVILTGDFHSSLVFEVPVDDWNFPLTENGPDYDPVTGDNAVAVEFVTPSITSQNFDEFVLYALPFRPIAGMGAKYIEKRFRKKVMRDRKLPDKRRNINPHLQWLNLRAHGYMLIELDHEQLQTDYYFIYKPWKKEATFVHAKRFLVKAGTAKVETIQLKDHSKASLLRQK